MWLKYLMGLWPGPNESRRDVVEDNPKDGEQSGLDAFMGKVYWHLWKLPVNGWGTLGFIIMGVMGIGALRSVM